MTDKDYQKKLAAILHADVVGYCRHTFEDEEGTHRVLIERRNALAAAIEACGGEIVKYAGDAVLADFPSVVNAVLCAVRFQKESDILNADLPKEHQLKFRIGINLGEVIIDSNDIFGNGVNVAQRLEQMAEPGGIRISDSVRIAVGQQLPLEYEYKGEQSVKNIPEPVRTYEIHMNPEVELPTPNIIRQTHSRQWTIVVTALFAVLLATTVVWYGYQEMENVSDSKQEAVIPVPERPSIAVLPFDNLTGNPDLEYFADGITEDIITNLAKFSGLFVINRHSVFYYKSKVVGLRDIRRKLGVRYALEGSLQNAGPKARITVQLVETDSGKHIWADRYDFEGTEVFAVRDEVLQRITSILMGSDSGFIVRTERERAMEEGEDRLSAYDYLMRGWKQWYLFTKETNLEARRLFEEATRRDPGYARAYSALAWTYAEAYERDWTEEYDKTSELAFKFAMKGYELDETDYRSHWALGWAHLYRWEHDKAAEHYQKALMLNQNDAELYAEMANFLIYAGEPDAAIEHLKLAMRLNPWHEQWYIENLGWAYEEAGRPWDAIAALEKIREPEEWIRRTLAAAYASVGDMKQARHQVDKILESNPQFSLVAHERFVKENYPYKTEALIDRWIEALRKTGVPE